MLKKLGQTINIPPPLEVGFDWRGDLYLTSVLNNIKTTML
jgi:hypothetical protein